jgi:uncharacterized protein (DUF1800 family)
LIVQFIIENSGLFGRFTVQSAKIMIATNRFGMGARPGEAQRAAADPQAWLLQQLQDPSASMLSDPGLRTSDRALASYFKFRKERRKAQKDKANSEETGNMAEVKPAEKNSPRDEIAREIEVRTRFAITTEQSFRERLVRFWSNHFTVSVTRNTVVPIAGAFEREAIRPHVSGRFLDMLMAAEMHPAMLLYLDNAQSVGPGSMAGKRRDRGLNENLAREILELHTLGVKGGYTQDDVIEFARALTGWTVASQRDSFPTGKTFFDERRHEPGRRTVLGKKYADSGGEQALHVLRDLAAKPQTAKFVATKLARHFIADDPPASAIEKLQHTFLETAGDLSRVSAELVKMDEAWDEEMKKFKLPDEFHISALRGLGADSVQRRVMRATYESLGQAPFSAPSPAGWPDESDAWLGPDAVKKRLEWSQAVAERMG